MIDKTLDEFSGVVIKVLLTIAGIVAPVIVPLAPAGFAGLAVYNVMGDSVDPTLSLLIAISGASGLELVGFIAAHTTLALYTAYQKKVGDIRRVYIGLGIIGLYLAAGITVIFQLDELTTSARAVGQGSIVLSLAVYVLTALMSDVRRMDIEVKEKQAESREYRRQRREEKLREKNAAHPIVSEKADTPPDRADTPDTEPVILSKTDFDAAIKSGKLDIRTVKSSVVAADYGVSDRTIRRWLEPYKVSTPSNSNGHGV